MRSGSVVWITGLSASGKTTLLGVVRDELVSRGTNPVCLDGDELRKVLRADESSYGPDARLSLAYQYADLCRYLAEQGHVVLIATIALFREIHTWNRANLPDYCEVLMDYPLEELERRDPKGLYAKFRRGEIRNLAGLDMEVDLPEYPTFRVNCPASELGVVSTAIIETISRDKTQSADSVK